MWADWQSQHLRFSWWLLSQKWALDSKMMLTPIPVRTPHPFIHKFLVLMHADVKPTPESEEAIRGHTVGRTRIFCRSSLLRYLNVKFENHDWETWRRFLLTVRKNITTPSITRIGILISKRVFGLLCNLKTILLELKQSAENPNEIIQNREEKFQVFLSLRSGMSRLRLCIIWIFVGVLALAVTISSEGPLLMLALMRTYHQIRFCGDFKCWCQHW